MSTSTLQCLPWARAARDEQRLTYDVWIVSVRPEHEAGITARVTNLLGRRRGSSGDPVRVLVVPETARRPGNLVGTLLAWRAACARAHAEGWDLTRGRRRIVLVHAAGEGRRAAPLVHAEDGDRSSLWLPGTLGGHPARLLEAVLTQITPLAASQPDAFLDVVWASQIFLPTLAPEAVPPPAGPLTKLVTGRSPSDPSARADVGVFFVRDGAVQRFVPQGQPLPDPGPHTALTDLGSFRLRADLLDVLTRQYLDPRPNGPRDLDPHLTGPLLGAGGPTLAEARAVQAALGDEPVVCVTSMGEDLPWWRLRRPAELRAFALATLPSSPHDALRHLLGIVHPITRSWLGDTWVEGPELSWQEVQDGISIGGIQVRNSIVQDSALWPWLEGGRTSVGAPMVRSCVVLGSTGGLDLEDTVFVASGGAGWRGGGGLAWRVAGDPPEAGGPSPTATGICAVRRPRLRDGIAVYHGFLGEDAKADQDRTRAEGPSWNDLSRLPPFRGPELNDRGAPDLDDYAPHLIVHPPISALALLRERLPPRSDLLSLLELAEDGRFLIALHRGSRPQLDLDAPLVPGRRFRPTEGAYRLHGDLETWRRLQWSPPRIAEALLRALLVHFIPAGPVGRHAHASARLSRFRWGPIEADDTLRHFLHQRVLDQDPGSVLDRLDAWDLAEDPDRVDLSAIYDALDVLAPPPDGLRTESHLRAWCRWRLERCGDVAGVLTDKLATTSRALLGRAGFVWTHPWVDHGQPIWIPRVDLRPRRLAESRTSDDDLARDLATQLLARHHGGAPPVLGVCGPAAAGKSSLCVSIAEHLDDAGLRVAFLAADDFCWQGDGFRYTQLDHVRDVRLYGPGIVDEIGLGHAIDEARKRCDCVIVEGVYVGRDPETRSRLDVLVGVILEDRARLEVKFGRDALGGKRRIDVVTDFADKVHHESRDGVRPTLAHADRIWDRGTGELWHRR